MVNIVSLRMIALIEGVTLLSLVGIAVPLKHLGGYPALVSWLGPLHGMVFMIYLWILVRTAAASDWTRSEVTRALVAALVPFGAFLNAGFMKRKEVAAKRDRLQTASLQS